MKQIIVTDKGEWVLVEELELKYLYNENGYVHIGIEGRKEPLLLEGTLGMDNAIALVQGDDHPAVEDAKKVVEEKKIPKLDTRPLMDVGTHPQVEAGIDG